MLFVSLLFCGTHKINLWSEFSSSFKVNFEAQSSLVCIFLFFCYTQKKKTEKHFYKICHIIKIDAAE